MEYQNIVHRKLKTLGKAKFLPNGILVLLANLLFAFGILWAVSSLLEHEAQAAMMGFFIFSGSGLILAIAAYRVIASKKE